MNGKSEKLIRILAFTLAFSYMSATMFHFVLPEIGKEFRLTFAQVSWVSTGYLLIYAIGTVLYGKLADRYPLKQLITVGLLIFIAGSVVGLAAQTYETLLAGRMLQAAGAAVIPGTAMIIPVRYFPEETRGRALGITATGLALGSVLGPIVSALIVSVVHWRWLFVLPMFIVVTLPYYRKYLDDDSGNRGRIDWLGGGLLACTVALLLLAITNGDWRYAGGGAAAFILFLLRVSRAADPFIPVSLFRMSSYTLGVATVVLMTGVSYALPFLTPLLMAEVHHLEPAWIGLVMVPAAAASVMLGRKGGRLADKKGNAALYAVASSLIMTGFLLLSLFADLPPIAVAGLLIFGNVGQTFMQISLSNAVSRTLPKAQVGVGMGMMGMLNFMSGAIAASLYSTIVDYGSSMRLAPLSTNPAAYVYSNIYLVLAVVHVVMLILVAMRAMPFLGRSAGRSAAG